MANNLRPETMQRITTPELADAFIAEQLTALKTQIGNRKVLLALSGGVDSSVVAALLIKAVGSQLTCVHVNHGLLRKGEPEQVVEVFRNQLGANLIYVDAVDQCSQARAEDDGGLGQLVVDSLLDEVAGLFDLLQPVDFLCHIDSFLLLCTFLILIGIAGG